MKPKRMRADDRKADILTAALSAATETHYLAITRDAVAERAGISGSAVLYHFKTMDRLRGELMRAAVERQCLPVLAQGILAQDATAMAAPAGLRDRAWGAAI